MRKKLKAVAPWLLAMAVCGTGSAFATGVFGGGGNTIDACVKPSNGSVRLLDASQTCNANEQAVSWNVQGPAGPIGPPGPQGDKGDKGDPGLVWRGAYSSAQSYDSGDAVSYQSASYVATGHVSAQTCTGTCLDQNAPGLNMTWSLLADKGDKGDKGETGDPGPQGAPGAPGAPGLSNAFQVDRLSLSGSGDELEPFNLGGPQSEIGRLSLPAGKFVVWAKADFENDNAAALADNRRVVTCELVPLGFGSFFSGGSHIGDLADTPIDSQQLGTVNLQVAFDGGSVARDVVLRCEVRDSQSPSQVIAKNIKIDAVQVSTLTSTTAP